jgi:copper homeostasis protein (lipoprotein)
MKQILPIAVLTLALGACGNERSNQTAADTTDTARQEAATYPSHNARNSLDYAGSYTGTLPCADCPGIETQIDLTYEGQFVKKTRYLGKNDAQANEISGKYTWNEAGNTITLEGVEGANQYFVGENTLSQLDQQGQRITGQLAENYMLRK